jgi:hypothetical protein
MCIAAGELRANKSITLTSYLSIFVVTTRTLKFRSARRASTRNMQYLCRVVLGRRMIH